MGRKVKYNYFFKGKGFKTDKRVSSFKGEPNTNLDRYDKRNGKFVSRRKFDNIGNAVKDYDVSDLHKKYDHVHDIIGFNRDTNDRVPTKKESKEIKKAKKERRFW